MHAMSFQESAHSCTQVCYTKRSTLTPCAATCAPLAAIRCIRCCFADRDPKHEFGEERIPGARFFDVDAVSASATDLPHMLPSVEAFAAAADALGIRNDSQVRSPARCVLNASCPTFCSPHGPQSVPQAPRHQALSGVRPH